ncbi:MAG: winged helix-turn-helix transcriptional regulator [Pararhodobacter sp.]|nr:winged helix-turn-helix transcriptional regulator [Pararhodobacter sp.]
MVSTATSAQQTQDDTARFLIALGMAEGEVDLGLLTEFPGPYLRVGYERAYQDFARLLGEDTLHPGYFTVLTLIRRNPGINQSTIGKVAGRDKSWVTKALRFMEDEDLIRRERVRDDRRAHASFVTDKGLALHRRMEEKAQQHLEHLWGVLGRENCAILVRMLRTLITRLPEAAGAPCAAAETAPSPRPRALSAGAG